MTLFLMLIGCGASLAQTEIDYGSNAAAGHYQKVNDILLYYEVYGSGHPLLLLHGNGGSIKSMSHQIPDLAKRFRVIAVDSRAQGRSSDSDSALTFSLIASDMNALLEKLGLDSVYVVGWSDGGIVGLHLAMSYPRKVSRLVSISANFVPDSNAFSQSSIDADKNDSFSALDPAAKRRVILESRFPERAPMIYDKLLDLDRKYPNLSAADLRSIAAPTLVMAGDHDIIKTTHTVALYQMLPHAQLAIVPDATHALPIQKPSVANGLIIDFLMQR